MKRIITLFLAIAMMLTFSVTAFAAEPEASVTPALNERVYLDDGTYIIVTLDVEDNGIAPAAAKYTRTGTKTVTDYNEDGEILWRYELTGTFDVHENISVICTSATYTHMIDSIYWNFSDGDAYAMANVAYGKGTFKKKVLFITVNTYRIDISITCDGTGNLS